MRNFPHRYYHRDVGVVAGDGVVAYDGIGAYGGTHVRIRALALHDESGDGGAGTCMVFRNHRRCRGTDWLTGQA